MKRRNVAHDGRTWSASLVAVLAAATPVAAQVTPYGSGANPPGSLVVTTGIPMVGESWAVGVADPTGAAAPGSLAYLGLAAVPDPAFPSGTLLPGFGLGAPGAPGEVLLSFVAPDPFLTLGPVAWAGAGSPPAEFALVIPLVPALAGATLYLQGALLDLAGPPSLGLTNGLAVTIAAPEFPGLVPLPAGSFLMGSAAADGEPYFGGIFSTSIPVHQVTLTRPFWLGRFEVTQAEYEALMGSNPSQFPGPDRPVERVNWIAAVAYCEALNAQQSALGLVPAGYQYRLPTEAEWEYACRAGTTTEFHFGDDLYCDQALFNFSWHESPPQKCHPFPLPPLPVGSFAPNGAGLYDMHGNVWEIVLDSFSFYTQSPKVDPYVSGGSQRVFRGGSTTTPSQWVRSACRGSQSPNYFSSDTGFRVALAPILGP
jgi:formylglycine-generating enzyme required for sulfatase activity